MDECVPYPHFIRTMLSFRVVTSYGDVVGPESGREIFTEFIILFFYVYLFSNPKRSRSGRGVSP